MRGNYSNAILARATLEVRMRTTWSVFLCTELIISGQAEVYPGYTRIPTGGV